MIALQHHRGPDHQGFWSSGPMALGYCRLSIYDLSKLGQQPMSDPSQRYWLVFNGAIYNFRELRAQLERLGCHFKSTSDTEVLVHGYAHWGRGLFERLRGMFAIAVWDQEQRKLTLARDRLGIKPLYYRYQAHIGELAFSSEIKPLLQNPQANDAMVYDFLADGLLDHCNETFFKGVLKLPAASFCEIQAGGRPTYFRYWDFQISSSVEPQDSQQDRLVAELVRGKLDETVRLHSSGDVDLGSCLSGGIDSSALTCILSQWRQNPLLTFTAGSRDPNLDESAYADLVAKPFGTISHKLIPEASGFLGSLDKLIWHQEEPFAGPGVYVQWLLMERIHQVGLKVVLDGQGADELFLGYRKFFIFYVRELLRRGEWKRAGNEAYSLLTNNGLWNQLDARSGLRYLFRTGNRFLDPDFLRNQGHRHSLEGSNGPIGRRLKLDLTQYSLPVLLRYEDKNSMAFSVESRVPFVDHELVELLASIPVSQKLRNGLSKYCLRNATQGLMPEPIRLRRNKLGFNVPWRAWMKESVANDMRETFKNSIHLQQWADPQALEKMIGGGGLQGAALPEDYLFRFYILEKWAQQFLRN